MVDIGKNWDDIHNYCWWNKSGVHQLRLVVYPTIYRVFCIHLRRCKISSINSTTHFVLKIRREEPTLEESKSYNNFLEEFWITLQKKTNISHPKKAPTWVDDFPRVGYCYFPGCGYPATNLEVEGEAPGEQQPTPSISLPGTAAAGGTEKLNRMVGDVKGNPNQKFNLTIQVG